MKLTTTIWLLATCPLFAKNYYIRPDGNDNDVGTSNLTAWKTIGRVNSADLNPGDKVLFKGGSTYSGLLYLAPEDSGTSTSPVTVSSYGSGRATLANDGSIYGYNSGGFDINNLDFIGVAGGSSSGITFYVDSNDGTRFPKVRISSVSISGFGSNGIEFGAYPSNTSSLAGYEGIEISDSTISANKNGGVFTYGRADQPGQHHTGVIVRGCEVFGNPGSTGNTGSGIILSGVDGGLIEKNRVYNNGAGNTGTGAGPVGIWCYDAAQVVMQYNISHDNKTGPSNVDGGGFDIDGGSTNCIIQFNYSYNNQGPGYLLAQYSGASAFTDNIIRYNLSQNDGRKGSGNVSKGGIHFWFSGSAGGIQRTQVYGNTVFMNPSPNATPVALRFQSGGTTIKNSVIRNNLFITTGGIRLIDSPTSSPSSTTINGNAYDPNGGNFRINWAGTQYGSLASFRTGSGKESLSGLPTGISGNGLIPTAGTETNLTDPELLSTLSAHKIPQGSPLVDAGVDLALSPGSVDFYSNPVPQGMGYDIGFHEKPLGTPISAQAAADTYVRDGNSALTNYGGDSSFKVKGSNTSSYRREGILRFDLSNFDPASAAPVYLVLKLKSYSSNGTSSATLRVRECFNDSWLENSVNWNNRPSAGTVINQTSLGDADEGVEIALDVTNYISSQKSGDGIASFVLDQPASNNVVFEFFSKEGGTSPKLVSTN